LFLCIFVVFCVKILTDSELLLFGRWLVCGCHGVTASKMSN